MCFLVVVVFFTTFHTCKKCFEFSEIATGAAIPPHPAQLLIVPEHGGVNYTHRCPPKQPEHVATSFPSHSHSWDPSSLPIRRSWHFLSPKFRRRHAAHTQSGIQSPSSCFTGDIRIWVQHLRCAARIRHRKSISCRPGLMKVTIYGAVGVNWTKQSSSITVYFFWLLRCSRWAIKSFFPKRPVLLWCKGLW